MEMLFIISPTGVLSIIFVDVLLDIFDIITRRNCGLKSESSYMDNGHGYRARDGSDGKPARAVFWTIFLVFIDIIVYGWMLPIFGAQLSGIITIVFGLDPLTELMLVIVTVFALIFAVFYANMEVEFWKHLFADDRGYKRVLQARDFINLLVIIYNFNQLYVAVRNMISDKGMKSEFLGQGIGYNILKSLADFGIPISDSLIKSYLPKHGITNLGSFFTNVDGQFVHGAQFVLAVAGLTASVSKLVYFNTLYTYMRAMEILSELPDQATSADLDAETDSVSDYTSDFTVCVNHPKDLTLKRELSGSFRDKKHL